MVAINEKNKAIKKKQMNSTDVLKLLDMVVINKNPLCT